MPQPIKVGQQVRRKSNGEIMRVVAVVDADYAKSHNCTTGAKICEWGKVGTGTRRRPFKDDEIEAV
jgi:uncharacterized protein YodC (DUF2158 family)